ncbi:MAG: ChaN family lipoprotein [Pyrinomonadaceae bacterium]
MSKIYFAVIYAAFLNVAAFGQIPYSGDQVRVFDARGNPASIEQVIRAMGENEAVFLGELHDDAVGHAVQMELFQRAVAQYGSTRAVALSLEMFERDVQIVVNEYLSGLISEAQFIASSRAWGNYKTDYRPLVELAKENNLPVIAANAPRRYVNMVSRNGRDILGRLSKDAKKWLAPLPYGQPSDTYSKKFKALMGASPEAQMGIDRILASQSLWDATMAHSVAKFIKDNKKPLAIHLNGGFHTESRLGTVEHLLGYRSKTKVLVVTIRYEENFNNFDNTKHHDLGDFVVLTDGKQPRSKRN